MNINVIANKENACISYGVAVLIIILTISLVVSSPITLTVYASSGHSKTPSYLSSTLYSFSFPSSIEARAFVGQPQQQSQFSSILTGQLPFGAVMHAYPYSYSGPLRYPFHSYQNQRSPLHPATGNIGSTLLSSVIWHPALNTNWQWQLTGTVDQSFNVAMYDIDMFDNAASVVTSLHHQGRKVVCYISAGTWENWRPDAAKFPNSVKGNYLAGYPDERWLDIRQISILGPIMNARMDLCKQKGFDGIEPDNVDGYQNNPGFPITYQDQIRYNEFLANQAHNRGLSIGLKNDLDQVRDLLPYFDWALNEECFTYNECGRLLPFVNTHKAVFEVEYNLLKTQFCPQANSMNFNSMKKHLDLDAWRSPCR